MQEGSPSLATRPPRFGHVLRNAHLGESIDNRADKALVERIIAIESNGDSNARNKRSSATGAGQFLDDRRKLFEDTDDLEPVLN
jgi:hypothetical protein